MGIPGPRNHAVSKFALNIWVR